MSEKFDLTADHPILLQLVQESLVKAKQLGADQAEAVISEENGFSVSARQGEVETVEHHKSKGLVITVYKNKCLGSASTSDLSAHSVQATVEKAYTIAHYSGQDPFSGLADPELLSYHYPHLDLWHHWNITPSEAIQMAIECEQTGSTFYPILWNLKPNQVNYLGQLQLIAGKEHQYRVKIINNAEYDISEIKSKLPLLSSEKITINLSKISNRLPKMPRG